MSKSFSIKKTSAHKNALVLLIAGMFVSFYLLESETLSNSVFTIASVLFSVAVFIVGAFINKGKVKIKVKPFYIFVAIFVIFCYASVLWAMNRHYVLIRSSVIVKTMLCIIMVYIIMDREKTVDTLLMGMMLGGYIVVLSCILYYGIGIVQVVISSSMRFSGLFLNNNLLGMLAANTIIINLYYYIYQKRCKKTLPMIAPSIIVLAAAGSRKSILLLFAGLFLMMLLHNRGNKNVVKKLLKGGTFTVLVFVGIYLMLNTNMFGNLQGRFQGLFNYITGEGHVNYSTLVRAELGRLGIRIFLQHPIVGIGIDNARIYGLQLTGRDYYLHNNYAELLADGGIVGFVCYYSMYIYLIYNMIKCRKNNNQEYDICFVLLLVHAVMEYGFVAYYLKDTYCYFMLFFLEVGILKRETKKVGMRRDGKSIVDKTGQVLS